MNKLRWKYLTTRSNLIKIGEYFLISFGFIWLLIECPSALSVKCRTIVDALDPWLLISALFISIIISIHSAFPRVLYTKKFKCTPTSISLKVGDLLDQTENIVIGSSNYFDFNHNNTTGASLKSQLIKKLFNNDVETINNLVKKSLEGRQNLAEMEDSKIGGNKLRYPEGTVAVLPQANRKVFVVILTKLMFIGNDKHTQSDPGMLNKALDGLWERIKIDGRKKKFSIPVLGAGLANVDLSYLLIIQSIILSFAIYSRKSAITKEMTLIVSPDDYNPEDFEEAIRFLNSLQI